MVTGAGSADSGEQGGELQRVQHRALLAFPSHLRPGDRGGRVSRDESVDDGVLVERGYGAEPAGHRGSRVPAALQVADAHFELAAGDPQNLPVVGLTPAQVRPQVLGVGRQGRLTVAARNEPTASLVTSRYPGTSWVVVVVIAAPLPAQPEAGLPAPLRSSTVLRCGTGSNCHARQRRDCVLRAGLDPDGRGGTAGRHCRGRGRVRVAIRRLDAWLERR
jgi:hypothetical protein